MTNARYLRSAWCTFPIRFGVMVQLVCVFSYLFECGLKSFSYLFLNRKLKKTIRFLLFIKHLSILISLLYWKLKCSNIFTLYVIIQHYTIVIIWFLYKLLSILIRQSKSIISFLLFLGSVSKNSRVLFNFKLINLKVALDTSMFWRIIYQNK